MRRSGGNKNRSDDGATIVEFAIVVGLFSDYLVGGTDKCNEIAIKWSGADHDWSGVQYAPNGAVDMSAANNSSFNGSILAYNMALKGAEFNLTYDDSYKSEPATTIQLQE
ncbi:MAG: hypothetical protein P1T08_15540 [Acidimicrobiia bacterium]|nr:hypothetical protein [Acidimicrobiia bacterium]